MRYRRSITIFEIEMKCTCSNKSSYYISLLSNLRLENSIWIAIGRDLNSNLVFYEVRTITVKKYLLTRITFKKGVSIFSAADSSSFGGALHEYRLHFLVLVWRQHAH